MMPHWPLSLPLQVVSTGCPHSGWSRDQHIKIDFYFVTIMILLFLWPTYFRGILSSVGCRVGYFVRIGVIYLPITGYLTGIGKSYQHCSVGIWLVFLCCKIWREYLLKIAGELFI